MFRRSFWFAAISIGAFTAGFLLAPALADEMPAGVAGYYVGGPNARLPNGGRPQKRVPFPEIRDWSSLRITLSRSVCFGACPAYTVEIDGDGTVCYHGEHYVAAVGDRTDHIDAARVRALFEQFRRADYFWTFDHYRAQVTDLPQFTTSISFDGNSKSVSDYAGRWIGMPEDVGDLERAIDDAAGTEKWVKGPK